jgi:hypothetical protein
LEKQFESGRTYRSRLRHLGADLAANRCTLREAVAQLARADKGKDPTWLARLRRMYRVRSDDECLAVNLIVHAAGPAFEDRPDRQRVLQRLRVEYREIYGSEPVWSYVPAQQVAGWTGTPLLPSK